MIAVTRPLERSSETVKLIEGRGRRALIVPGVNIIPVLREDVEEEIGELSSYDWLVLSSASGADIMHRYFARGLKNLKIAVIGPKTAEFLKERGIDVEIIPKKYKAENLASELIETGIEGKRILVARADIGREVLVKELKKHADVKEVVIYRTMKPCDATPMREMLGALEKGKMEAVIFTSSQNVKNIFDALEAERLLAGLKKTKVCAIGPITAKTLEEKGADVDVMPDEYTVEACLEAIS
jgi:uroporphyrinogen III methyltransferase/synthase